MPDLIREMHEFGCIQELIFENLKHPIDIDYLGNKHPLTCDIVTQHHRHRFTLPTNHHLRKLFLDQIEKSQEGTIRSLEQEMIDQRNILIANEQAENKLHIAVGRDVGSCRSIFAASPPTLQHIHKLKGKLLTPFVQAQTWT